MTKTMEKEFVTYDLALRMKALGFDEPCLTRWGCTSKKLYLLSFKPLSNKDEEVLSGDFIAAPTWQSAFEFFRDKHSLESNIIFQQVYYEHGDKNVYEVIIESNVDYDFNLNITPLEGFKKHKEAQKSCLEKLCEIVEQKKERL